MTSTSTSTSTALPGTPPPTDLPTGTVLGRLVRVDRSAYDVVTADGNRRLPTLPPPEQATVGDWLAVTEDAVVAVLPRSSLLVRGASSGHSRSQPLAANVDAVLICASLVAHLPVRRIERLLTIDRGIDLAIAGGALCRGRVGF